MQLHIYTCIYIYIYIYTYIQGVPVLKVHIYIFEEFENLSVEKKTLSTALGFELRSFE